jgi:hypothetical protein
VWKQARFGHRLVGDAFQEATVLRSLVGSHAGFLCECVVLAANRRRLNYLTGAPDGSRC